MNKDLSSYFSARRFARWSYKKMLVSGALALVVLCGGVGAAVPALSAVSGQPVAQPTAAPAPQPTPNLSLLASDWKDTLRPVATPTPVPDVELVMELSGKSQAIEVEVYQKVVNEDGSVSQEALTGVELEVVITCLSLDKLKDDSNKYDAQQSRVGAIGKYTLNAKTGSYKLSKLNPGKYKVEITPLDGYAVPAAEEVTVKEKVSYKKVEVEVEQATGAAGQEDSKPATDTSTTEKPQQGITSAESSAEKLTTTAYVKTAANESTYFWSYGGSLYLHYEDGTYSPYKAIFTQDPEGVEYLLKAEYDPNALLRAAELNSQAALASLEPSSAAATGLSARRAGLVLRTLSSTSAAPESVASQPASEPPASSAATPEPATPTPEPATPTPEPATPTPEPATPTPEVTPEPATPTPDAGSQPGSEATPTPTPTPAAGSQPGGETTPFPSPESSPTPTPEPATPTPSPTPTATPTATPAPTAPPVAAYWFHKDDKCQGKQGFKLPDPTTVVVGYQYSGWQVIDGGQYYYDPVTHKPLTGTQIIDGTSYLFNLDGKLSTQVKGIDVSKWNGTSIDWKKVKESGVEFVIIRCGYRGYGSEGKLVEDPNFAANLAGAKAAGLRVGVYFFSQAITEEEAVEEASACLKLIKGTKLDYPVYFDTEFAKTDRTGRADNLSKADRTDIAVAFCETIRNSGYRAGVYASESFFEHQLNFSTLTKKGYSIWNAHYGVSASGIRCDMWQYTGSGSVPGISGKVDINISYIG